MKYAHLPTLRFKKPSGLTTVYSHDFAVLITVMESTGSQTKTWHPRIWADWNINVIHILYIREMVICFWIFYVVFGVAVFLHAISIHLWSVSKERFIAYRKKHPIAWQMVHTSLFTWRNNTFTQDVRNDYLLRRYEREYALTRQRPYRI